MSSGINDQLNQMAQMRKEANKNLSDMAKGYRSMIESQLKAIKDMNDGINSMTSEQYEEERKRMREKLKDMVRYYRQNSKYLTKADKHYYKVFYKNRRNDLRELEREARYRFRDIEEEGIDTFKKIGDKISNIAEKLRDWKVALDVGDISDGVKEQVATVFESQKKLQQITGIRLDELRKLSDKFRKDSELTGNRIGTDEYMDSAVNLAEWGYDIKVIEKMGKVLTEISKATGVSTDNMQKLVEYSDSIGNSDMAYQFGNLAKAISQNRDLYTNADSMMKTFEDRFNEIKYMSGGDINKFNRMMEDQMQFTAMTNATWLNGHGDSIRQMIDNIRKGDEDALKQVSSLGLNAFDLKNMASQGNYSDVLQTVLNAIKNNYNNMDEMTKSKLAGTFGLDETMIQDIVSNYNDADMVKIRDAFKQAQAESKKKDLLKQYITEEMVVSPFERLKNAFSNSSIGSKLEEFMDFTDMSTSEALLGLNALGGIVGKLGGVGKWIGGKLGWGATATKAATAGTATASGIGSTITGGLASIGGGSALAGGAGLLGGIGGAIGIGSGIYDLFKSFTDNRMSNKDKQDARFSGASKIGMVGAGALAGSVFGPIGTLIGAGIGGIGALLTGSTVGKFVSNIFSNNIKPFFTNTLPNFFSNIFPSLGSSLGKFVSTTIPNKFKEFLLGIGDIFNKGLPYALGYISGRVYKFFSKDIPNALSSLWDGATNFITQTVPNWISSVSNKIGTFFGETLPNKLGEFWDSTTVFITQTLPNWLEATSNSFVKFFMEDLPNKMTDFFNSVGVFFTQTMPNWIEETGKSLKNFFLTTLPEKWGKFWDGVVSWFKSGFSSGSSGDTTQIDGSHLNGLDYVPKDGYIAKLHKGESVLTSKEADEWRNNQNGASVKSWFSNMIKSIAPTLKRPVIIQSANNDTTSQSNYPTIASTSGTDKAVWDFFTKLGYSRQATAGIMGNLYQESGCYTGHLDPSCIQGQGRGPAAGIAQWENYNTKSGRWQSMANYASSKGRSWTDLQSQLEYLDKELRGADGCTAMLLNKKVGGYSAFKALTDINNATKVFEESFERAGKPNMENRYKKAQEYYNTFAGNAYAQGTPWVPNDQIALIHKGEAIIPADQNPINNGTKSDIISNSNDFNSREIVDVIKWMVNRLEKKLDETSPRNSEPSRSIPVSPMRIRKSDEVFSF